ncbi:hypothetical protein AURDEDRAFT_186509 [Auricularia subglabra TFB-10046 SS5]|nr:hypothetical protein AURDEDRAFT_186509 [Auricularia subglabra TFB-10046 SS5]
MSSTFCFSVAETLRCAGLTRQESLFLLIPALVEALIGLPLLYIKRGRRCRMYWLFVLEGLVYAALATMDYIVHTRAADLSQMAAFKIVDQVIGATSFIPLLCYTLFLYLFSRARLFPLLSKSWSKLLSRTVLISIPVIIALNEVSSFLGVRYTPLQLPGGKTTLGVGFANAAALGPWNIIANTTLALVTAYQAIHFCVAFLHFFQKAFRGERAFSTASERDLRLYSMNGTGWLAVGLKLGAVETVLGFAGFTFAPTIVRRVLRVLGRAFVLIGVSLSPDAPDSEGFMMFGSPGGPRGDMQQRRGGSGRSNLRAMISQPQTETFRRLDANDASTIFKGASTVNLNTAATKPTSQRVTVHFDAAKTPRLEMRFSDFNVPAVPSLRSVRSSTGSEGSVYTVRDSHAVPMIQAPPPARRRGATTGSMSEKAAMRPSIVSTGSDSLEAMKQLVPQFPGPPARAMRAQTLPDIVETPAELQRKLSKRKPAPLPSPGMLQQAFPLQPPVTRLSIRVDTGYVFVKTPRPDSFVLVSPYIADDGTVDYEPSTPTSGISRQTSMRSSVTRHTRADSTPLTTPPTAMTVGTPLSLAERKADLGRLARRALRDTGGQPLHTPISSQSGGAPRPPSGFHVEEEDGPAPPLPSGGRRRRGAADVPHSVRYDSTEVLGIPWLAPEPDERGRDDDDDAPVPESFETTAPIAAGPGRVKSVGAVRARTTPAPRVIHQTHASVQVEKMLASAASSAAGPFADPPGAQLMRADSVDSGVLSADDRADVRASIIRARSPR